MNIIPELPSDNPVKCDDKHIVTVNGQAFGVENALDAANQAERLTASRPSDASNRACIGVDKGWHLGSANAVVPWSWHGAKYNTAQPQPYSWKDISTF
jgi:hypothetical protein